MQLVLNTRGAYLRLKDGCFYVSVEGQGKIISPKKVESILITTGVQLSSDALQLATDNNIDIVFLDKFGDPFGRLWLAKLGSTTRIRRGQLVASTSLEGLEYARGWVRQKLENQVHFLTVLANKRPAKQEHIRKAAGQLKELDQKIQQIVLTHKTAADTLRGLEGSAGRIYFDALSLIQPAAFPFKGRSRRPAKDEFNAILNYCYGVLYGMVERACILSGLEPYLGFLHEDNYNKKALVFDFIEPYRIWAEETTVYLFSQRQVRKNLFERLPNGLVLNKEGKQVVIAAFNERLDGAVRYKGRNISRRNIIQYDCQAFAQQLLKIDLRRDPIARF